MSVMKWFIVFMFFGIGILVASFLGDSYNHTKTVTVFAPAECSTTDARGCPWPAYITITRADSCGFLAHPNLSLCSDNLKEPVRCTEPQKIYLNCAVWPTITGTIGIKKDRWASLPGWCGKCRMIKPVKHKCTYADESALNQFFYFREKPLVWDTQLGVIDLAKKCGIGWPKNAK
jgi:hypothetical protein